MGSIDALVRVLTQLRDMLDVGGRLGALAADAAATAADSWARFVVQTVDISGGGAFTSDTVIAEFTPLTRALADAALVPIAMWAFYRILFGHGTFTQYTARILLPRVLVAAAAVNFALPVFQAAIDLENALCRTVLAAGGSRIHFADLVTGWAHDITPLPGLGPLISAVLLVGFLLLAIAYVVRYALLVLLAILAPLAAVLMVLPDTQHYAKEWSSLFLTTLLMQPLQLCILVVALAMEAEDHSLLRHGFALAALWMCFKVPGALHTASSVGSHAQSFAKHHVERLAHAAAKL